MKWLLRHLTNSRNDMLAHVFYIAQNAIVPEFAELSSRTISDMRLFQHRDAHFPWHVVCHQLQRSNDTKDKQNPRYIGQSAIAV